ncbi:zinc finger CCHC domain-containing protein 9-like [Helianthus annuus]|uniref:zinc finger CCHC domain-containing protein 9-like n=1 Tax=Helianthus annuus TaxID=4232 RepID=UPI000B904879|nr:zinc finger CCHC domain-containing protein 9-like [Helianthus annuus]
MTNSDKTTVNRTIDDATHANDATIVNLKINKGVLQAMIDAAVGKAVRKAVKKFKKPNATCSTSHLRLHSFTHEKDLVHTSDTKDELKRKREKDNSHASKKKSKPELKKNKQKSDKKPVCKTCKKRHYGRCRFESKPLPCGICKSSEHKTLDCKDIKDAVCYDCNEKGHIKTTCPRYAKGGVVKDRKPENESA